jgi:hypothetical protein
MFLFCFPCAHMIHPFAALLVVGGTARWGLAAGATHSALQFLPSSTAVMVHFKQSHG